MAEAHLDHPGEIRWFGAHVPAVIKGSCPHTACTHSGHGVIAWGPTYDRYELVACGSTNPLDEDDGDCAMRCRAWVDGNGRVVTAWLNIDPAGPS